MSAKKLSDEQSRGGYNPRPAKSSRRKQVGPLPTSGKEEKGTNAFKRKIHEKADDKR